LVDLGAISTLQQQDLLYRHKTSPFVNRAFQGKVVRTLVRGMTVFREGKIVSEPVGRLIKPDRRAATAPGLRQGGRPQTVGKRGVNVGQSGQPN
jgi:hypothetical protein